jgi:DNA-binding LacI/PurR family transcriptional regulator
MADDRSGGRSAVEHLIAQGCRRIATITGPRDMVGGVDRLQGYTDALLAHGLPVEPARIVSGDWGRASGAAAMRQLLDQAPDLDAVFAASDAMAAGALPVLREAGRSVPGDVQVVGFDDSGLAATLDPPLTTVRHPLDRISDEMVRLLTDVINGRTPLSITVPTTLVVRDSSPA